nr:hypothetical protein Itr_chr13CG10180 [Ipomoea trifida]
MAPTNQFQHCRISAIADPEIIWELRDYHFRVILGQTQIPFKPIKNRQRNFVSFTNHQKLQEPVRHVFPVADAVVEQLLFRIEGEGFGGEFDVGVDVNAAREKFLKNCGVFAEEFDGASWDFQGVFGLSDEV